jgi:predicted  nucleic acid-binding Zn-ribbon protein
MGAIKDLEHEIEQKNKKIRDLVKEKQNAEKRTEEEVNAIRDELDLAKEKIIQL